MTPAYQPPGTVTERFISLRKFEEFVQIVERMRKAQSAYFKNRNPENLQVARDAERRLDVSIEEFWAGRTPSLFGEEGANGD